MRRSITALLAVGIAILCSPARAQIKVPDWPIKPVRIVSPFAPGGSSDTLARLLAEQLSQKFGVQFFVENKGGAGGLIGTVAVAGAEPDGYTLMISSIGTHVTAPLTKGKVGYDPVTSFTHIAYIGGPPIVIAVHPSLGVKTFKEFLAAAKSRSTPLPYISPGPGTLGNLLAELLAQKEGLKLSHVAYKGSGQGMQDLVGGFVKMGSITWTAAHGQMRAGTVIPLAVSSAKRMPEYPDLPTLKELGYPELAASTWFAVAAPAGVGKSIVERLNKAIIAALDAPAVRKRLDAEGVETNPMSPAALTQFIKDELAKWRPVVAKANAAPAK